MKKCENCKYFDGQDCLMPIWVDGEYYPGRETEPDSSCELYEERHDLPV